MEELFSISLPHDLEQVWNDASSLRLFEDIVYGQWGLIIWSPDRVIKEQKRIAERQRDYLQGDLIVGEFLGDSDLIVVRCNPTAHDFGNVVVALPVDPRQEWQIVAQSIMSLLRKFLDSNGDKFWEKN